MIYFMIGFILGLFVQKNIIPIIDSIFELIYIAIEGKKSNSMYDLSIINKEIKELNETETKNNVLGFRSKGDIDA